MPEEHGFPDYTESQMVGSTWAFVLSNQALLRTVMDTQARILALLENRQEDEVRQELKEQYQQQLEKVRLALVEGEIKGKLRE